MCVCVCVCVCVCLFVCALFLGFDYSLGLVVNHGRQGGIGKQFEFVEDVCSQSAASSQTLSFASNGVARISVVTFKRS